LIKKRRALSTELGGVSFLHKWNEDICSKVANAKFSKKRIEIDLLNVYQVKIGGFYYDEILAKSR